MGDRFAAAAEAIARSGGVGAFLAGPLVDALPVTGAAISTLGDFLGTETVAASDPRSARLDELQIDLGEGPCWDAMWSRLPVLEPDLREAPTRTWPAFSRAILNENVGAIFAFPLMIGPLRIGAIDLYSPHPQELTDRETAETTTLAAIVSREVLRRALANLADPGLSDDGNRYSRRAVHQATGMVIAQLGISAEDAELLIQGHAFASSTSMRRVADSILAGELEFTADGAVIGDSS